MDEKSGQQWDCERLREVKKTKSNAFVIKRMILKLAAISNGGRQRAVTPPGMLNPQSGSRFRLFVSATGNWTRINLIVSS
jgi:hypothetical protein